MQHGFTCENWANSLSASMGMWPRSSWQQSLSEPIESESVRERAAEYINTVNNNDNNKTRWLTAQASAWEQRSDGCTACTETPWRPNCWGSLWPTAGRRLDAAGNQFSLKRAETQCDGAQRKLKEHLLKYGALREMFELPYINLTATVGTIQKHDI